MTPSPTLYGSRQAREASRTDPFRPLLGGAICLDFVNTVDRHNDPSASDDLGSGYIRLLQWCSHAGLIGDDAVGTLQGAARDDPRAAAGVRRRALAFRAALHGVVAAILAGNHAGRDDLAILNAETGDARSHEVLVDAEHGLAWRVVGPLELDSPLQIVVRDAPGLLTSDRVERIRACANPACERIFLDMSRNGSRQFCSASGCGSRIRVQRFRARRNDHG